MAEARQETELHIEGIASGSAGGKVSRRADSVRMTTSRPGEAILTSGRLEDYSASLVWRPLQHVAFGAGYNEFITRLDVSASGYDGTLRWNYGGARLFVNFSF